MAIAFENMVENIGCLALTQLGISPIPLEPDLKRHTLLIPRKNRIISYTMIKLPIFGSSPNPGDDKFNDRFPSVNVGKDGHHFGSQTHVF